MNKPIQLIFFVLICNTLTTSQVLRPIDKAQVIFHAKIVQDSLNRFIYSYDITNKTNSEKASDSFDLTVIDSLLTDNITTTTGPVNKNWYISGSTEEIITGAAANRFVDLPIPPADALFPGETMSMSFKSSGLPSIMLYYAQSFSVPFDEDEEDSLFALGFTASQINSYWKTDSYKNQTVAPNTNLLSLLPLTFLDTLTSYTTQSRTLGWITTQTIADKYLNYFTTAKTQLLNGNRTSAVATLQSVVTHTINDSSGNLTSEAYALLRFNTQYVLPHISSLVIVKISMGGSGHSIPLPSVYVVCKSTTPETVLGYTDINGIVTKEIPNITTATFKIEKNGVTETITRNISQNPLITTALKIPHLVAVRVWKSGSTQTIPLPGVYVTCTSTQPHTVLGYTNASGVITKEMPSITTATFRLEKNGVVKTVTQNVSNNPIVETSLQTN